jgi:glycerol-3-phosphate acyltransferase PlsY
MMWPVAVVLCYLLGSMPGSYLIARWAAGVDLRHVGSGNVGASNVLRVAGPAAYVAAIALDAAKGLAAVLIVPLLGGGHLLQMAGGIAAVVGHMFPVWLRFKGGKGVATTVGVFLGLSPLATLLAAGVWVVVILSTRYASVASLLAVGSLPFLLCGVHRWGRPELLVLSAVLFGVVLWRHRPNLKRLSEGRETRLTWKPKRSRTS